MKRLHDTLSLSDISLTTIKESRSNWDYLLDEIFFFIYYIYTRRSSACRLSRASECHLQTCDQKHNVDKMMLIKPSVKSQWQSETLELCWVLPLCCCVDGTNVVTLCWMWQLITRRHSVKLTDLRAYCGHHRTEALRGQLETFFISMDLFYKSDLNCSLSGVYDLIRII